MLAPPWIPVPPPGYGGIEAMVALLCEGLVERGHDVTLLAAPGSRSSAKIRELLPLAGSIYGRRMWSASCRNPSAASY